MFQYHEKKTARPIVLKSRSIQKRTTQKKGKSMFGKILFIVLSVSLGGVSIAQLSYGESTTKTVKATGTQTSITPRSTKKVQPTSTTTTSSNTRATTTTEGYPRQVLNEDALKKISNSLCTEGFKAYVGTNKKNVCRSKASSPDIAYSCVWAKRGVAAYPTTAQGPCNLDYAEHRGNIITKDQFSSYPPFSYGVEAWSNTPLSRGIEAQCCYRAAVGSMTSN